jgi:hypothetical protein
MLTLSVCGSLEGKQVARKFADTATLAVHPVRFSERTIDAQIASRFKVLEKFSWIVPKSLEECARGDAYNRFHVRTMLRSGHGAF